MSSPVNPVDTSCLSLPPEFEAKYAEFGKAVLMSAYTQAIQQKRNAYEDLSLQVPITVMIGLAPMLNAMEKAPPPVQLKPCSPGTIHRFWCIQVPNFGPICFFAAKPGG